MGSLYSQEGGRKITKACGQVSLYDWLQLDSIFSISGKARFIWNGNWSSRIIERGMDPHKLGRWSYISLNGHTKFNISTSI